MCVTRQSCCPFALLPRMLSYSVAYTSSCLLRDSLDDDGPPSGPSTTIAALSDAWRGVPACFQCRGDGTEMQKAAAACNDGSMTA